MSEKEEMALDEMLESIKDLDEKSREDFCNYAQGFAQGMKFNPKLKPAAGE